MTTPTDPRLQRLHEALKAAEGYLLNAKIDLETGAPKRTAMMTIDGGLRIVRQAISEAESHPEIGEVKS
jgi:hypothetical protein